MSLLAPAWLLAMVLAGFVFLLHARRRRRVEVPTVFIWRTLESSFRPRRSLRVPPINLLLLLQVAAIGFVALALAQPRIGGASPSEHVVFLVDDSGSMRATDIEPTRFEAAVAVVRDAVENKADGAGRTTIVAAATPSRLIAARQAARNGIEPLLSAMSVGDGEADWVGAIRNIEATVRDGEELRIVILSDDPNPPVDLVESAFPEAVVESRAIGTDVPNTRIAATVEAIDASAGAWLVTGEIKVAGVELREVPIAIAFRPQGDDGELDWGVITVAVPEAGETGGLEDEPASAVSIPFESELSFPGPGTITLRLPDDFGPHDNAVRFVLNEEPRHAQILLIGAGDAALVRALRAMDDIDLFQAESLPSNDRDFDLVIVNDVEVARSPSTNVLYLDRGRIAGEPEPSVSADAYIVGWDQTHPLSIGIDWSSLTDPRGYAAPLLAGARSVIESADGPLIQARTRPDGREVRVALAIDASGWANDTSFPVFVANLIDWLDLHLGTASPPSCIVGHPCTVAASWIGGQIYADDGAVLWRGAPAGATTVPDDANAGFVPMLAGLYRIEIDGRSQAIAVNPPAAADVSIAVHGDASTDTPQISRPLEMWRVLILVALALLLVEAWIAGRGSERFLRRQALSRGTPFSGRRRMQLLARAGVIFLLVLCVAALPLPSREPAEAVAMVLSPAAESDGPNVDHDAFVAAANEAIRTGPNVAVVEASRPARAIVDYGDTEGVITLDPPGAPTAVDLDRAVSLAAAMLPADRPGRIVLAGDRVSDDLAPMIARLTDIGTPVDVVRLSDMSDGEVLVETVTLPSQIYAGDSFMLSALVFAASPTDAVVTLLRNGEVVSESAVVLDAGGNRIEAAFDAVESGADLFEVVVAAPNDRVDGNNRRGVVANVGTSPAILIVTPEQEWGEHFADALAVQAIPSTVVAPNRAPFYMDQWLQYDAVVLMNVPAIDLTTRQQELLADHVEIHGHGLLILGGENSFGPGGYYQTPLERISPLSARVPQDAPGAAMVFVLDRSGSMRAAVEDVNRLEIAKEATLSAIELLHEESQVGIIVFDSEAHVILPMQERSDVAAIAEALRPVQPGGGTALFPALSEAIALLEGLDAEAKHIVVMTDGLLEPADFPALLERAAAAGATVSTVAIGDGADVGRAELIARLGGGAFHATQDFKALPSILSQEAMMMSSSPLRIGAAPVYWVDRSADYLTSLPDALPPVANYVATSLQPTATLHLATEDEDGNEMPILASWRYGNGMVLSLATHGAGSGTQDWMELPQYPMLWSQIIRHFLPATRGPGIYATAVQNGDAIVLTAEIVGADGAPVTGLEVTAVVEDAEGSPLVLTETSPATYVVRIDGLDAGSQTFELMAGEDTATVEAYVNYPALLNFNSVRFDDLVAVAVGTGGEVLEAASFVANTEWTFRMASAWRPWALAAMVLFLIELTLRYAPGMFTALRRRRIPKAVPAAA